VYNIASIRLEKILSKLNGLIMVEEHQDSLSACDLDSLRRATARVEFSPPGVSGMEKALRVDSSKLEPGLVSLILQEPATFLDGSCLEAGGFQYLGSSDLCRKLLRDLFNYDGNKEQEPFTLGTYFADDQMYLFWAFESGSDHVGLIAEVDCLSEELQNLANAVLVLSHSEVEEAA
jgi:hypothetical protein